MRLKEVELFEELYELEWCSGYLSGFSMGCTAAILISLMQLLQHNYILVITFVIGLLVGIWLLILQLREKERIQEEIISEVSK